MHDDPYRLRKKVKQMADTNAEVRKAKQQVHEASREQDKKNRQVNSNPSTNERNNSDGKKENHSQKAKGQPKK